MIFEVFYNRIITYQSNIPPISNYSSSAGGGGGGGAFLVLAFASLPESTTRVFQLETVKSTSNLLLAFDSFI